MIDLPNIKDIRKEKVMVNDVKFGCLKPLPNFIFDKQKTRINHSTEVKFTLNKFNFKQ